MPKNCDIVAFQVEGVHEDVASGFFEASAANGLTTYAQFNRKIVDSRGDFFDVVQPSLTEVEYIHLEGAPAWKTMTEKARERNPKYLFFNSFQRDSVATVARDLDRPVWGVVHNPTLFRNSEGCMDLALRGKVEALVLAPHVAYALETEIPELKGHIHVHHPIGWAKGGPAQWTPPAPDAPLDILIPGTLDYAGRAFEALLDYITETNLDDVRPFRFSIVSGGPDRGTFENEIAERKLGHLFDIEPLDPKTKRVPHAALMKRVHSCDVLMPMLPPKRMDFLRKKISTSLSMIQGTARPSILPKITADTYGIPAINSPSAAPYDLRGLDLSTKNLSEYRLKMLRLYGRLAQENMSSVANLIGASNS